MTYLFYAFTSLASQVDSRGSDRVEIGRGRVPAGSRGGGGIDACRAIVSALSVLAFVKFCRWWWSKTKGKRGREEGQMGNPLGIPRNIKAIREFRKGRIVCHRAD